MKRRGILSITAVFIGILFLIVFAGGIYGGTHIVKNIRTSSLIMQCEAVDRALEFWAKAHKGVNAESISYDSNGNMNFTQKRLYPETLDELGEVQKLGYFAKETIDLNQFFYSTMDNGTQYRLEVTLPNGEIYRSPRSNT